MELEATILEKIQNGQKQLFGKLIDVYQDRIYGTALKIVGNEEDAHEVTQHVFVRCYRYLPKFRGDAKISVWLYRIAYNEALTLLRQRKKYVFDEDENEVADRPVEFPSVEQDFESNHRKETIHKALAQLRAEEKALVSLFYLEELSYAEIVKVTGLSLANVKVKIHRAKKKLKAILAPHFETEAV